MLDIKNTARGLGHRLWSRVEQLAASQYFFVFLLALLGVVLRGYTYRGTFMLPYSYHYLDPTLFSRDIAFFPYDLNFFFLVNAQMSRIMSYETMFFVGYVVSSILMAMGVYLLTTTLFKKKEIGYLAVLLTIFVKPAISAMTTIWTYYYYKDLAMAFILISLALFLQKKYVWSFLLLGVASLLHILFSLYFVAFYGLFFLATLLWSRLAAIREITALDRKRMLLGFVILGFFLAGPVYLILSSEQPANSAAEMSSWFTILKTRSFDHFFPSTWITNSVVVFLPLLVLFLLFLYFLCFKKGDFACKNNALEHNTQVGPEEVRVENSYRVEMGLYLFLVFVLGAMAIVFSEIIPVRMLTIVQLFRPTIMLTFFALCFAAYLIYSIWKKGMLEARRDYLMVSMLLFGSLFWYDFRMLMISLTLLLVVVFDFELEHFLGYKKKKMLTWAVFGGVAVVFLLSIISLCFESFLYVGYVGEQVFRFQDFTYVILFLMLLIFGMDILSSKKIVTHYVRVATAVVLVVGIIASGVIAVRESTIHSDDPCYTARGQFDFSEHLQYPTFPVTEHMKMALWAKENTAKDALFLIPPECGSDFRNFGERSVFMDFKYGTMSTYSVDFGLEWWKRVQAINPERTEYDHHTFYRNLVADYSNMTEEHVLELVQEYKVDYVVFTSGKNMSFPMAYKNEEYVVYDVRQIRE